MDERINNENSTYRSFPFFRILYRNMYLIIAIVVIAVILGTVYGMVRVKPVYTAKSDALFYVSFDQSEQSGNYQTGNSLAKKYMLTFSDFIKTAEVEQAAKSINRDYGISRGAVSVNYTNDNFIISISYTASTAELAERRLEDYIKAASDEFSAKPPVPEVRSIALVKLQNSNKITVSSGTTSYSFIGFVGGLVIGVAAAVLLYLLDNKLKDKDELEEITGVSLLSYIEKQ